MPSFIEYIDNECRPIKCSNGRPLAELNLTVRVYNALFRNGFRTVDQLKVFLRQQGANGLLEIRGLGEKSLKEIYVALGLPAPAPTKEPVKERVRKTREAIPHTKDEGEIAKWLSKDSVLNLDEIIRKQMKNSLEDRIMQVLLNS